MRAYLRRLFSTRERLAFVGLCFPQAWMFVISSGAVSSAQPFQLAFHGGMLACLVVLALMALRRQPGWPRSLDAAGAAAMALTALAGLVLPCLPAGLAGPAGLAVGVLGGCGLGWCFSTWFRVLCALPLRDAFCYVLLGFSAGALGCLVLKLIEGISVAAVLLVGALLPAGSAVALRRCAGMVDLDADAVPVAACAGAAREGSALGAVVVLVVQIVVYVMVFGNGFVFSVLQDSLASSPHGTATALLNYGLRALLPLVLMAWLAVQEGPDAEVYRPVFNVAMLVGVFVLLGAWFIAGLDTLVAHALVSTARNMVLMLLFLSCLKLVRESGKSPWFVFGVGRGAYEVSVIAGIAGYAWFVRTLGGVSIGQDLVYLTAMCVIAFLTSCFFATAQSLGGTSAAGRAPADGTGAAKGSRADASGAAADDAFGVLRERYALNDREYQILTMFCHGSSKRRIAEQIGISENTVRWYLQQLYVRLDVHSRDELLELVDHPAG